LRTRAIPERIRGVFTTRRYTNPRLPLPLPLSVCATGDDFDIREFHSEILRLGPVPIHVVELAMYQWIRAQIGRASAAVALSNALMFAALLVGWAAVGILA